MKIIQPVKTLRIISLLGCWLLAQQLCAGQPAGRVVWWGQSFDWRDSQSGHTNGVLESGNEFLTNAIAIAAQGSGGLVLKNDGTVIGFGFSPCFLNNQSHVPDGLSNVVSIAMEGTSCWAVKKDGSVAQWGREEDSEHFFDSLSDVKAVVFAGFGSWAYLVLKNDGTVLGLGGRQSTSARDPAKNPPIRSVMVGEQILSDVAALASRGNSPLVLRRDGTVIALDYPHPGGLFVQAPYEYIPAEPIMVDGTILSNVVAIAGGRGFALALKRDGMVVTMGIILRPKRPYRRDSAM